MSVLKIKDQNNDWIQIPTIKGDKGDPFTYADFTTEQLESLKGKDGISPTVSVASDTSDDYRLSFTDETHTVTTPNLIPEAEKILSVYPTDTASGSVASFPDGADNIPLKSCIVHVEPVQDLHGYDSPWSAGGGKNLIIPSDRSFTNNGVSCVCSASAETVSLKGTATNSGGRTAKMTNDIILPAGEYMLSVTAVSGTKQGQYIVNKTDGNTYLSSSRFSLEEETSVYVGANVSNGTVYDEVVRIQIESRSTATDWTPYENICPISGWTGCEVQRTGKNLIEPKFYAGLDYNVAVGSKLVTTLTDVTNTVTKTDNVYTKSGSAWSQNMSMMLPLGKAFVGQTLRFSGRVEANEFRNAYYVTDADYIVKRKTGSMNEPPRWNITVEDGDAYLFWYINSARAGTITLTEPQIELGSTATPYEPYTGQTYPITFPTEAGTVYGGYIDPINGELTITHGTVDLATLTGWISNMSGQNAIEIAITLNGKKVGRTNIISDMLKTGTETSAVDVAVFSIRGYPSTELIAVKAPKSVVTDRDGLAAWIGANHPMACYELAEPIHYPLTPTEIKTLLGQNNIWADTGDTEVEYRADVTKYIDRKITEIVSALT